MRYDLELNDPGPMIESLCVAPGAVLRIIGTPPGQVTVDPEEAVSQHYEAGVVDVRFLRAGTVEVTIPQEDRTDTVTVVVTLS